MPSTPNTALLHECRDLFRERLLESVRETLDGVAESLSALADKTTNFEARNRYLDARILAVRHRDVIEAQFERRLMAEFQSRLDRTKDRQSIAELSLEDLQLVGEDDLNETLSFNDMATQMRRHCEDEMTALDQRAAVLLGRDHIEADDNPFGSKVVADAFKHACQQVDCPVEVRLLFMRSFEKLAMDGIRGSCREVNDLLVANAILPKIRYGIARNESKAAAAAGVPAAEAAAAPQPTQQEQAAAKQQDMFSMLTELLGGPGAAKGGSGAGGAGGGGPAGGGVFRDLTAVGSGLGVGGAPLVQGAQLLGSLTQLQRGDMSTLDAAVAAELAPILAQAGNMQNVLRQLKDTSVGAGMGHMDAMTLEIVSMLFDALFDDAKVPLALKGLIGKLQLPMLKVAIADKELFSSKGHPARRLLDTIGDLGKRLPRDLGADSPMFVQVAGFIDELIRVFQENMDVFDATRLQLEAMIAAADAQIALRMQDSQRELEQAERLALAKSEVQDDLRARVAAFPEMPHAVFEFLAQHWIKYLVVVRARDGASSEPWRAASQVTDQLIWSVQPKTTQDDRRALAKSIVELLRSLKAGVTAGGIEAEAATKFYGALMECHTAALRPVQPGAAHETPKAFETAAPELDFTARVTIDNPFGEGKVEVTDDDLDFTGQAATAMEIATDAPKRPSRPAQKVRLPSALVVGAWVTVEEAQSRHDRPARLHYVSPLKSHFLFVDRQGNKVFECSRTMLARRLNLGEVVLLEGEPDSSLFDRIMEGIFGKLKKAPELQPA
jgi:hypothetical protein